MIKPFDKAKFIALAEYVWASGVPGTASDLAFLMMNIDMKAYRDLGQPITGAMYTKGRHHPEVFDLGEGWFRAFVRRRTPWWARAAGVVATAFVLKAALRGD